MQLPIIFTALLASIAIATPLNPRDDQAQATQQDGQAQAVHQGEQAQAAHQDAQAHQADQGKQYYPPGILNPNQFYRPYPYRPNRWNPNNYVPRPRGYLDRYRDFYGNYPSWNHPRYGQVTWDPRGIRTTGAPYYSYDQDGNLVGVA